MWSGSGPAGPAKAHGLFNIVGGMWPLLSMGTFELVTGPKADRWLVRTVAGLMVANGIAQWRAEPSPDGLAGARRIGVGTAATLAAVDLAYAVPGRIRRVYLVDALLETGWLLAWARSGRSQG